MDSKKMRFKKYVANDGYCEVCRAPMMLMETQLAHILPQTKPNLKKYGPEIIHHELNMKLCCSLRCNSAVMIAPGKTALIDEHIEKIKQSIKGDNDEGDKT